jgi:hypothetical protein
VRGVRIYGLFAVSLTHGRLPVALRPWGLTLLPGTRCQRGAALVVPDRNRGRIVSQVACDCFRLIHEIDDLTLPGAGRDGVQYLAPVVGRPLRVGREREETLLEFLKFALLVRADRGLDQFGIFRRGGAVLRGREHE